MDHFGTECGLVAGEVPVHLLGVVDVSLSKTANPEMLGVPCGSLISDACLDAIQYVQVPIFQASVCEEKITSE